MNNKMKFDYFCVCLFLLDERAAFLIWEKSEVSPKLHPAEHHFVLCILVTDCVSCILVADISLEHWIKI